MSKKLFNVLAIFMVLAMLLSACKPKATATPEPVATEPPPAATTEAMPEKGIYDDVDPSGQTVIFWHQHTRGREEALNQIVDEFNNTNEWGITVVAEYQGGYNDIFNKMLVVLNTPDAPNIVVAYQNQAATYQLAEGLADMNPMVDSAVWGLSEEEQNDFFPGFWAQDVFPTYGDARLGFPPNRSMEVMYFNSDWLAELKAAGAIDFDGPPSTPEQFKAATCAAVENPFSGATAEGPIGYELSVDASRFASWTFAFGGDVFDYNTSKYTYNSDAAQQAMNFLQDLFNSGCATIVTESYGDQTDFGNGRLLFTVGSSSGLPYYKAAVGDGANFNWSVAPIPHTTAEPVMNVYGASVSIPKTTPEGELAAFLFLKYYTSAPVQAIWAKASEYFPVRASVAENLADYFAENPAYKTAFDMLQYSHFEPPVPGYDFVRNKVSETMAAIAEGADVGAALAALDEESNIMLSEQMTSPLPTPVPTDTPEPPPPPFKACEVTDVGGIDDKSFNATAWKGIEDAIAELGIEGKYLESQQQTDYEKNVNAFLEEGCDIIFGVGFLLGDAIKAAAEANTEQPFAIVDFGYDPLIPNVRGSGYQIDQATFLAGYLAAGMTQTGKVGTYGGIQIPPVTAFMDGFYMGVQAYNEKHDTAVEVLGWDPASQTGLFTGNFESTDDGRRMGETLLDEGADIIMPVAGPVGAGTLAVLKERGAGLLIGVDTDWSVYYPESAEFVLASALKKMDLWVLDTIKKVMDGTFAAENFLGTLENGYVGLAFGSAWDSQIPAELKAEIEALIAGIIDGSIATMP